MPKDYEIKDEILTWATFIPEEAITRLGETLRSKWTNTGPREKELREKACKKWGFPSCVAVNSGTSALRASYAMLGVGTGDEVISTPFSFIATNTAILEQGAKPVFADIRYDDLNVDPKSIEAKITDKTKAISIVHYGGNPCDLDEIRAIAKKHNLPLIEDSAHALGSKYKGKYIGETGDIVCFSLQVVKIINSGDGGFIVTGKEDYYKELKKIIWYGIDREDKERDVLDPLPSSFKGEKLGFKYNMNDIVATLAGAGVDHFDEPAKRRKEIGERYRKEFADLKKIKLLTYYPDREPNYQIFPVHVTDRSAFAKYMQERKIMLRINNRRNDIYPMFGGFCADLVELKRADEDAILLPIHYDLTDQQVDHIINSVKEYEAI